MSSARPQFYSLLVDPSSLGSPNGPMCSCKLPANLGPPCIFTLPEQQQQTIKRKGWWDKYTERSEFRWIKASNVRRNNGDLPFQIIKSKDLNKKILNRESWIWVKNNQVSYFYCWTRTFTRQFAFCWAILLFKWIDADFQWSDFIFKDSYCIMNIRAEKFLILKTSFQVKQHYC